MRRTLGIIAALCLLVGCGDDDQHGPPELHLGEDICAQCGMIVSDARFAAALFAQNQYGSFEQKAFDDIGDMVEWEVANPDAKVSAKYVRDYESLTWIRAEMAVIVESDELQTPMASGLAACTTQVQAQDLVKRYSGEIMAYDALVERAMD